MRFDFPSLHVLAHHPRRTLNSLFHGKKKCGPTFPVEKIGVVTAALYLLGRLVRGMLVQLLPQVVVDEALVVDLLGPT